MPLLDYKLTNSGDLEMSTLGVPIQIYEVDAINQIARSAMSLWKGNWFRDPQRGVDWLGVLKLVYVRNEIIDIVSSALKRVAYIDEVVDVSIKVINEDRTAEITYTVKAFGKFITGSESV